jgi:hypothetical protein
VIFSLKELRFLRIAKPWGFCDLVLWLYGRIGSGWCGTACRGESFPMHKKMLDFIKRIKSYDQLKLLV